MQRTISTLIVALMAGSFAVASPGGAPIALAGTGGCTITARTPALHTRVTP